MTLQMHTELAALIDHYYEADITEEGWALLQVHMAYCDSCQKEFEERGIHEATERLERAAREGREARGESD